MIVVFIIVTAVAILAVIAVGNVIASKQNPPQVTLGNNSSDLDCNALCLQFNQRRSEKCMAQAAVEAAKTRLLFLIAQRDAALKAWAVATAASIAAMFIPFIGSIVSATLATAAAISFTAFLGFSGAVNGASADLITKTADAATAASRQAEASSLLLSSS